VVRVRHSDFVEAAYGSGGTFFAVFWRHILPNSLTAVLALPPSSSARPFWRSQP
jgi:peptide/nickel transport system permease protein